MFLWKLLYNRNVVRHRQTFKELLSFMFNPSFYTFILTRPEDSVLIPDKTKQKQNTIGMTTEDKEE